MLQLISKDNMKSIKVVGTYRVHRIFNGRLIINTISFFNTPPPPQIKKKEGVVSSFKIQFSICNKKNLCYGEKKVGASSSVHGLNFDPPPRKIIKLGIVWQ